MGIQINGQTDTVTATDGSINVGGDVTIPGVLTYEDVTNIDAIGIITARSGVNATGDITFGVNSKAKLFENGTQSGVQATSSTSSAHLMTHDGNEDIHVDPSGYIKFEVAGSERVRITSTGTLDFKTADGVGINFRESGYINIDSDNDDSNRNFSFYDAKGTGSEKRLMTLTDAGDMGLGTATPTSFGPTLQVAGTDPALLLQDTATAVDYFGMNIASGAVNTWFDDASAFVIHTASALSGSGLAERLRIFNDGSVRIGDSSIAVAAVGSGPTLAINGSAPEITLRDSASGNPYAVMRTNDYGSLTLEADQGNNAANSTIHFRVDNAERMRINSSYLLHGDTASDLSGTHATMFVGSNHAFQRDGNAGTYLSIGLGAANGTVDIEADARSGNYPDMRFITYNDEQLRITSAGKIGINESSPTARLDINHPNTERGLVVRSRYGDINNAMVKFDADPDTNNGDGNVLHIHGGNSRTDSEILNIDSTGCGNIFQIRGDGLTRVYKHLQIEHASNTAKIIFNEFGANDIKAQIEMDQVNGSNGQLRFHTQGDGTLSERLRLTSDGRLRLATDYISQTQFDNSHAYFDYNPTQTTWGSTGNKDVYMRPALVVRTPVRDSVNNPAIVIAENGGQATGRNSLVFFNSDYNSNAGYVKARLYTQVGSSYNSTAFYIDVADGSRNIQNRFIIDVNGNFSGSSSSNISDARLKENIQTIENPIDKIRGLTGRTFTWTDASTRNDGRTHYGFIAQEVDTVVSDLVKHDSGLTWFDADDNIVGEFDENAANSSKTVHEQGVIPILVEALKEALDKIDTLEARITALEGS